MKYSRHILLLATTGMMIKFKIKCIMHTWFQQKLKMNFKQLKIFNHEKFKAFFSVFFSIFNVSF